MRDTGKGRLKIKKKHSPFGALEADSHGMVIYVYDIAEHTPPS